MALQGNALLAEVIRARMRQVVPALASLVPVDTGRLKRSVKLEIIERRNRVEVRVVLLDYLRYVNARGTNRKIGSVIGEVLNTVVAQAVADVQQYILEQAAQGIDRALSELNRRGGNARAALRLTYGSNLNRGS